MQLNEPLLAGIKSPQDLQKLSFSELNLLASEIRECIIATVSRNGGHLASNLGVVELTIALHRVFNSPQDKIVWDVGHQCYAHKLITGRYTEFDTLRRLNGLAGFPKSSESPHDSFNTGHASTSISAALGLLAADRIQGGNNRVAAVIGDGALTGGLAYEALSHAGQLGLPLVVILNDNKMSIGPNVGGLSKYLSRLSMKSNYQRFRRNFDNMAKKIPYIGDLFFDMVVRLKRAIKAVFYTDNFFVDLGFEYVGPIGGHAIQQLAEVIRDAGNLGKPVVIHVITRKGKGYGFAENDPGKYHGVSSFLASEGLAEPALSEPGGSLSAFTQVFSEALLKAGQGDGRVAAITAAMEKGTGLNLFKQAFPGRFFDAGIAEAHAVTFAAGLAARGLRPVAAIYSTFMQRAVDGVIHDVCLQNLPVVFALDRSGFVSDDGETHQGLFDISLFRSAPNMAILAPAGKEELEAMLGWSLSNSGPAIIRYPKDVCPAGDPAFLEPVVKGRGVWIRRPGANRRVCVAFTGSLYEQVLDGCQRLAAMGIDVGLYNLRFLKPIDEDYLTGIMDDYELMVFVEEGVKAGGFGEYAAELALRSNCPCRVQVLAVHEKFIPLGKRHELLRLNGLDGEGIAAFVSKALANAYASLAWAEGGK
ncbi:1-deoxy-D-xylulose-5-phosphate synthase [Leadbettera azotonutricia]|uniref:1-deoxy-D-xylulose-5-phosphate synthase n=1 Tax=Leadbettera azotonutricia (strain ATCC BAA-888 / DSM 13862 / ZAS-9) TaxID=545695 RepID=F5YEY0_LEAAZ|nr:1-deoxy-D-xylulose-5-phosphate synthase [Leadbettera azotonutricia]AEF80740.1 1-deoxy-D-xylulose-5-phosphate synthase [Leadbettera azotonutricia ZAS-9]